MTFEISRLEEVNKTLHLLNHRNKNQHRRSVWWRKFSMLRRCTGKLVEEIERRNITSMLARAEFMVGTLLPSVYHSFTQLLNDRQFSALGLVLLAQISEIWKIVSNLLEHQGGAGVVQVANDAGQITSTVGIQEDLGEAVERTATFLSPNPVKSDPAVMEGNIPELRGPLDHEVIRPEPENVTPDEQGETSQSKRIVAGAELHLAPEATSLPGKKTKKKKKKTAKSNPIDELFQGLG